MTYRVGDKVIYLHEPQRITTILAVGVGNSSYLIERFDGSGWSPNNDDVVNYGLLKSKKYYWARGEDLKPVITKAAESNVFETNMERAKRIYKPGVMFDSLGGIKGILVPDEPIYTQQVDGNIELRDKFGTYLGIVYSSTTGRWATHTTETNLEKAKRIYKPGVSFKSVDGRYAVSVPGDPEFSENVKGKIELFDKSRGYSYGTIYNARTLEWAKIIDNHFVRTAGALATSTKDSDVFGTIPKPRQTYGSWYEQAEKEAMEAMFGNSVPPKPRAYPPGGYPDFSDRYKPIPALQMTDTDRDFELWKKTGMMITGSPTIVVKRDKKKDEYFDQEPVMLKTKSKKKR